MEISKKAFQKPRTPIDLQQYVDDAYEFICGPEDILHAARLKKEPYKTFQEELLPFSAFCTWKYGNRTDVLCSLVPGTTGRDAIVHHLTTDVKHSVEITWPIDGKQIVQNNKQLNESHTIWRTGWYDDGNTELKKAMERILNKAYDKSQKDYRSAGGSTLIFVFDEFSLFSRSDPKKVEILNNLIKQMREIDFRVDEVLLMLAQSREKPKTFITIKKRASN